VQGDPDETNLVTANASEIGITAISSSTSWPRIGPVAVPTSLSKNSRKLVLRKFQRGSFTA
jgi:hypothetical protein